MSTPPEEDLHGVPDRLLPEAAFAFEIGASGRTGERAAHRKTGEIEYHQVKRHRRAGADFFLERKVGEVQQR